MKIDKKMFKKVATIGVVGLVLGMTAGGVVFYDKDVPCPEPVIEYQNVTVTEYIDLTEVQKLEAFNSGVDSVIVVEDLSEELAKSMSAYDNLKEVLEQAMSFVEDNVDEDADLDYILFEVDARVEAEAYIANNFKSLLKDGDYFDDGEVFDNYRTSEVSIKKIYEATIEDRDYEDKDLTLSYEVKFKAKEDGEDREYVSFEIVVPFEEGEMDEEGIELSLL